MTYPKYCWFHGHPDTLVILTYIYMNNMEMMWIWCGIQCTIWSKICKTIMIYYKTTVQISTFYDTLRNTKSKTHTYIFVGIARWGYWALSQCCYGGVAVETPEGWENHSVLPSSDLFWLSQVTFSGVRWPPFGWSKGHFETPGWFKVTWLDPPVGVGGHVFNHIKGSLTRVTHFERSGFLWCISHGISEKSRVEMIMLIGLSWEFKTGLEGMFKGG